MNKSERNNEETTTTPSPQKRDEWAVVEDLLFRLGVKNFADLPKELREARRSPQRIAALCTFLRVHHYRPAIGPGMLVTRLRNDHPEIPLGDGWTFGSDDKRTGEDRLAAGYQQLDGMTEEEQHALAERVLRNTPQWWHYEQCGLTNDAVRKALAARLTNTCEETT